MKTTWKTPPIAVAGIVLMATLAITACNADIKDKNMTSSAHVAVGWTSTITNYMGYSVSNSEGNDNISSNGLYLANPLLAKTALRGVNLQRPRLLPWSTWHCRPAGWVW